MKYLYLVMYTVGIFSAFMLGREYQIKKNPESTMYGIVGYNIEKDGITYTAVKSSDHTCVVVKNYETGKEYELKFLKRNSVHLIDNEILTAVGGG